MKSSHLDLHEVYYDCIESTQENSWTKICGQYILCPENELNQNYLQNNSSRMTIILSLLDSYYLLSCKEVIHQYMLENYQQNIAFLKEMNCAQSDWA